MDVEELLGKQQREKQASLAAFLSAVLEEVKRESKGRRLLSDNIVLRRPSLLARLRVRFALWRATR